MKNKLKEAVQRFLRAAAERVKKLKPAFRSGAAKAKATGKKAYKFILKRVKSKVHMIVFSIVSLTTGAVLFHLFGDMHVAIIGGASMLMLCTSKGYMQDFTMTSTLVGAVCYGTYPNIWMAILAGAMCWYLMSELSKYIIKLGKKEDNESFTEIMLNQFQAIEVGGMLNKFIGYAKRWVEPDGSVTDPEFKSRTAKLTTFMPDPTTGEIKKVREFGFLFDGHGLIHILNLYLVKRFGTIWIGLKGIVTEKQLDMDFMTVENGKPVPKKFTTYTVFDSFGYLFTAEHLKTLSTASVKVSAQLLMFVDNLHTIFYTLPSGIWSSRGQSVFEDLARGHVALKDFKDLLKEHGGGEINVTSAQIEHNARQIKEASDTLFGAVVESDDAQKSFIDACGHFPVNLRIIEFEIEGNEEYKKLLQKKTFATLEYGAKLEEQKGKSAVAEESVTTAGFEAQAKLKERMVRVDADKNYVTDVITPIKDDPNALKTLQTKQISEMDGLRVLGGDAGVLIDSEDKKTGGK